MVVPPEEFCGFARQFSQDLDIVFADADQAINQYRDGLSNAQKIHLDRFVAEIVDNASDRELDILWRDSGAQICFKKRGALRKFLRTVVSAWGKQDG